jgi:hypothetical protein
MRDRFGRPDRRDEPMDPRLLGVLNMIERHLGSIAGSLSAPRTWAGTTTEYERGRTDAIRELAVMTPADRAEILSRARHPSTTGERPEAQPGPGAATWVPPHDDELGPE